ncbi:MAG: hypothetical protein B7733_15895 [Myxococcales bacterium FL481]|nr:MAG: hypothetical protein B7733_15895 [Myxococcales bacterium FL481]
MYGVLKYVMYGGAIATLVPFVTDVNQLAFAQGLPVTPHQLFQYGGIAMVVIGFIGRRLTAPKQQVRYDA